MKIVNCKLKIDERGEIATALTLISIGLMLLGVVAGKVAVQNTTQIQSKAAPGDTPTPDLRKKETEPCGIDGGTCQMNKNCSEGAQSGNSECAGVLICCKTLNPSPTPIPGAPTAKISCSGEDKHCVGENDCPAGQEISNSDCVGSVCCKILPTPTTDPQDKKCIDNGGDRCTTSLYCSNNGQKKEGDFCDSPWVCCKLSSSSTSPSPTTGPTGAPPSCEDIRAGRDGDCTNPADTGPCDYGSTKYKCAQGDLGYPLWCGNDPGDRTKNNWYRVNTLEQTIGDCAGGKSVTKPSPPPGSPKGCDSFNADCWDTKKVNSCTPGNYTYNCGATCPYDSSLGTGVPFLCGDDGKTLYDMNRFGECTGACPGSGKSLAKSDECKGKSDGTILSNSRKQCVFNSAKNQWQWMMLVNKCNNGIKYETPGDFTGTGCTPNPDGDAFAAATGDPIPTLVTKARAGSSNTGGSQYCYPYSCPYNSGTFSVQNGKLYNNEKCYGDPVGAYADLTICRAKLGNGCDFVSGGGTGKGKCVSDANTCGQGYNGNVYSIWGPAGNQVNIPLCSGQNGNCCEPAGGFKPKLGPTIYLTPAPTQPSSGNSTFNGTSCSVSYPNNIIAGANFAASVSTTKYILIPNVSLEFINTTSPKVFRTVASVLHDGLPSEQKPTNWVTTTWNFNSINLPQGTYTVYFRFYNSGFTSRAPYSTVDPGSDVAGDTECKDHLDGFKVPTSAVSSSPPTPTPTGTAPKCNVTVDAMSDPCAKCMNSNLTLNVDCPTTKQKINLYCKDPGNINTCSAVFDNTCVKSIDTNSKCTPPERPLLFLSYNNDSYNVVVEGMKAEIITAKYASLYVLNATRVPGLQHEFCNPGLETAPGGCTFGTPASFQTQT